MLLGDLTEHIKFKKDELIDLITINLVLAFLFSFTYYNINHSLNQGFLSVFLSFFLFLFIMFFLRNTFIKIVGYIEGHEISLRMTYFNRFGLRSWDRISYWTNNGIKRIPTYFITILLYIFTFGFFIFPSLWNYKVKQIPHRYIGKKRRVEYRYREISDYRYSKTLFAGSFFFFIFAFIIKYITLKLSLNFISPYTFMLYWIAFFNTIPIPGTEGYELFSRNVIGWIASITILSLSLFALTIFNNLVLVIFVLILTIIITTITLLWNMLMT